MSAAYSAVVKTGKYEVTSRSLGCFTTTEEEEERIGAPPWHTAAETIKAGRQ